MTLPLAERARRPLTLIDAGALGKRVRAPEANDEVLQILMESFGASARNEAVPRQGIVIEWDFEDQPPWHVALHSSGGSARRGHAAAPDVRICCRAEDWVNLATARINPLRALLRRDLRISGNPLKLVQAARALA